MSLGLGLLFLLCACLFVRSPSRALACLSDPRFLVLSGGVYGFSSLLPDRFLRWFFNVETARAISLFPSHLVDFGATYLTATGIGLLCASLFRLRSQSSEGTVVESPSRPLSVASEFFSKRARTEVLEPTLRDMLDEHIEALAEFEATGRNLYLWKARMVVVRGYWSFWTAIFAQTPLSFAKWIFKLWKAV